MKITENQLRKLIRQEKRNLTETRDSSQINFGRFLGMLEDVYMNAANTGNFHADLDSVAAWLGFNTEDLFDTVNKNRNAVFEEHPWLEDLVDEYANGGTEDWEQGYAESPQMYSDRY